MKRLTKEQIAKIIELIKEGKSLNQISKILGKGKTTVYYHFKKIKGLTIRKIVIDYSDNELIGEFIGLIAGDGCLNKTKDYHYRVYLFFNKTEKDYVEELKKVLKKLFDKLPLIFDRGDIFILCYYSKEIFTFVKDYLSWKKDDRKSHSVHLRGKKYSKQFKIGFLRGSIDSDGYLSKKQIVFSTSSPRLAKNIKQFLSDLGFKYTHSVRKDKRENRVDMHHINLGVKERYGFFNLIKPREIKNLCVGGGSNSGNHTSACGFPR